MITKQLGRPAARCTHTWSDLEPDCSGAGPQLSLVATEACWLIPPDGGRPAAATAAAEWLAMSWCARAQDSARDILRCRAQGAEWWCRVWGAGCRVRGAGCRARGAGYGVVVQGAAAEGLPLHQSFWGTRSAPSVQLTEEKAEAF